MDYPAIALVEITGIATGIVTADAMVKRAPIALLHAGTVHPGRYLIHIGGTVASVEEAHSAALETAGEDLFSEVLLPAVHPSVVSTMEPVGCHLEGDALVIVETSASPDLVRAADAAVKATEIDIVSMHLADDLGGNAYVLFSGDLAEAQAAAEIAASRVPQQRLLGCRVIPQLDATLAKILESEPRFEWGEQLEPEGAEHDATR